MTVGTRADFYEGRGTEAEWLGSIAWDGYPDGIDKEILEATDSEIYRRAVAKFLEREDATFPDMGWPWPWDDSQTTDYAYALDEGKVWSSCFGHGWFDPLESREDPDEDPEGYTEEKTAVFPNMAERKKVAWDRRSGVLFINAPEKQ